MRLLRLVALDKSRAMQKFRITWLRKGDANTNIFHLMANIRKQRNFIHLLQADENIALNQNEKQEAVYSHFQNHIGTHVPRSCLINLPSLEWHPKDLSHLELSFSEEELRKVIAETQKEKPPGPDGFIGLFFNHCWKIIKEDVINATNQFYCLNQQGLQFLNQAYVVLIPKKDNPRVVSDFRPIRLIHSFVKIISKLLTNKLALELEGLISVNQTAFIKKKYT
jgi:hypothetical protein